VRLDPDTFTLLATCVEVQRASDGAFDVCLAPRMAALGFHERSADGLDPYAPGAPGAIGLELDPREHSVRFRAPGMALDLGAAGKGFALDQAGRVLCAAGVRDALLHGGTSTVLGLGAPPGRAAWGVALAGAGAPTAQLRERALSVSAQHGRTRIDAAGVRHGHVLDPRTELSVAGEGAAAVVAESALLADCWSTALLVLAGRAATPVLPPGTVAAALGTAAGWRLLGPPDDAFVIQRALPA
jgi:thiamine biosynthesis lipoprotein